MIGVEAKAFRFQGMKLPVMLEDGIYVPINCNFSAVDMIWKSKNQVFGVQVHINRGHDDVARKFSNLCEKANWFNKYEIYLLYLSPNDACSMKTKVSDYRGDSGNQILIQYITLSSVDCLESLEKFISI